MYVPHIKWRMPTQSSFQEPEHAVNINELLLRQAMLFRQFTPCFPDIISLCPVRHLKLSPGDTFRTIASRDIGRLCCCTLVVRGRTRKFNTVPASQTRPEAFESKSATIAGVIFFVLWTEQYGPEQWLDAISKCLGLYITKTHHSSM